VISYHIVSYIISSLHEPITPTCPHITADRQDSSKSFCHRNGVHSLNSSHWYSSCGWHCAWVVYGWRWWWRRPQLHINAHEVPATVNYILVRWFSFTHSLTPCHHCIVKQLHDVLAKQIYLVSGQTARACPIVCRTMQHVHRPLTSILCPFITSMVVYDLVHLGGGGNREASGIGSRD